MTAQNIGKRESDAPTQVERTEEARVFVPRVDITETEREVRLTADMPGVDDKNVDIDLDRNVLTIRGKCAPEAPQGFSPAYREYLTGNYERAFTLSDEIDRDRIEAIVKNGVLRLTLPKAEEAQPKRISVKAG